MTNSKNTKKSLYASALALLLCFVMLIGTTFAWFTDSVTSGTNKIVAGNLDIELYKGDMIKDGNGIVTDVTYTNKVTAETKLFDDNALWEPGHTEVAYIKIVNEGSLALKYEMAINVGSEVSGENVDGETFRISDHLKFDAVEITEDQFYATREDAVTAVGGTAGNLASKYVQGSMASGAPAKYYAVVVYMPETVGNEANHNGEVAPSVKLGLKLVATQLNSEYDSFGNDYDEFAGYESKLMQTGRIYNALEDKGAVKQSSLYLKSGALETAKHLSFTVRQTESTINSSTYETSLIDSEGNNVTLLKKMEMTLYVPANKLDVTVTHNGTTMDSGDVAYVKSSGEIRIKVTDFGEYKILWRDPTPEEASYEAFKNGGTLTYDTEQSSYLRHSGTNRTYTFDATLTYTGSGNGNYPGAMNFYGSVTTTPTITLNGSDNGGIIAENAYCVHVGTSRGANVVVNGGRYFAPVSAFNVQKGTLTINGGFFGFTTPTEQYGTSYLLNCLDNAYNNGTASIIVKGGTFVNFNPADNAAEGAGTNFVAEGYKVVSETQSNGDIWYTVVAE